MWGLLDLFYPGETAREKDLAAQNAALEARRVAMGRDTPEWAAAQTEAFDSNGGTGSDNAQILGAAADGAVEGLKSLPGTVRGTLTGVVGWSLAWVPWWGWLVGAFLVFLWLGGGVWAKGILARRK
jgi:hypothetical protein